MGADDPIKAAERRGYARGYSAGRRRQKVDRDNVARIRQEQARFDRFLAAAMTGLLAGPAPWRTGEKPDECPTDYARTAAQLARAMLGCHP